jgi:hypothetical protein
MRYIPSANSWKSRAPRTVESAIFLRYYQGDAMMGEWILNEPDCGKVLICEVGLHEYLPYFVTYKTRSRVDGIRSGMSVDIPSRIPATGSAARNNWWKLRTSRAETGGN